MPACCFTDEANDELRGGLGAGERLAPLGGDRQPVT